MFPLKFEINYGEICEKSSQKNSTKKYKKKGSEKSTKKSSIPTNLILKLYQKINLALLVKKRTYPYYIPYVIRVLQ